MARKVNRGKSVRASTKTDRPTTVAVDNVVAQLKRMGDKRYRDGMARFAIPSANAFGFPVGELHKLAKRLGQSHELALALWDAEWYEARMLAVFVDEPSRVTPAHMDRWCRDFDSWAICDTACFHLFDRTPHAWRKIYSWAKRKPEFQKRAAFALRASLALHDKRTDDDERFVDSLQLVEQSASDERNFVRKAVNWALRAIGKRAGLRDAAVAAAKRLAASEDATARWVGKDALRELQKSKTKR
jgi:3-methyladenine DNA glycosylase AlkD